MKQTDLVLNYIKNHGSIEPKSAYSKLGVYRLSAVIYKLKQKGHKITCVIETGFNQFGERTRYGRYFLF